MQTLTRIHVLHYDTTGCPQSLHLALASEEQMNDSSTPIKSVSFKTKSVRRGGKNEKEKEKTTSPAKESSSKYRVPFVPSWPKGLYDVCSNSLWKQLSDWKALVNKLNKKSHEKKLLDDFKITVPDSAHEQRSDKKRKHSDYSADYKSNKYQKNDNRKRGSHSNRHSDDRKRYTRRRKHDSSPDRSISSSEESASSVERSSNRRSRRSKKDPSPERDRSAARVLGGILQRR